jgi:hypothetical protein
MQVGLLSTFITTVFDRTIPPLFFEIINASSGVHPYDRIFKAMVLGFSFSLELMS